MIRIDRQEENKMIGVNLYKPDEIRDESFKYAAIRSAIPGKFPEGTGSREKK